MVVKPQSEKSENTPTPNNQTVTIGEGVSPDKSIGNILKLTNSPKFSWEKVPDTSKEGTIDEVVIVTYADGSIDKIPVKIIVIQPTSTNTVNTGSTNTGTTNTGTTSPTNS